MKITFDCPDKINGLLTMTIESADYQEKVEKTLKDYRKNAQVPGFRKGQVPMGMIKRKYGMAVKMDVINHMLNDEVLKYVRENKIQMLGDPLPNDEKSNTKGFEHEGEDIIFAFDIAVAPEFKAELTNKDKVDYYTIKVDEKLIDDQVKMYASQAGEFVQAQEWSGNDTLKGDLRQLDAEGNTLEGGITTDSGMLMPSYFGSDEQKKLFEGCKAGDIITFNPKKAYPNNDAEVAALLKVKKEEVAGLESDFSFQVTEVRHYQPAEVDQKLFDRVFGEGNVTDEKAFRDRIAEGLKAQFAGGSDIKFLQDLRAYVEQKVGQLQYPDALLKRILQQKSKAKGEEYVENTYENSIKALTWHLIKEQLAAANQIKVTDDDVWAIAKETTRSQFAQYGMSDVADDLLEKFTDEQLKKDDNVNSFVERAVDIKLTAALKNVVKLNQKSVTLDEFNKMMEGK